MGPLKPFVDVAVSVKVAGWPLAMVTDAEVLPLTVRVNAGDGAEPPLAVPVSSTVSGTCVALLTTESVPVCTPAEDGVKVMLIAHWAPAASCAPEAGHVPLLR